MIDEANGANSRAATLRCAFCLTLNRIDARRAHERPKCGACGRPILLDRPVMVDGADFDRLVRDAELPVLVDFYADWCAPCKVIAPILDELARERTGRLLVAKLDTDRSPGVSARFGIRGIPTLILFRDGSEAHRVTGAVGRHELEAMVDSS